MAEGVKYCYELTGREGKTLWDSLDQKSFDESVAEQVKFYEKEARQGGECRDAFIN